MLCMLKFGTIQDRIGIWAAIEPFEIRLGFGAQLNHFGIWMVIEPFGIRLGFGRRLNHLEINIIFVRFYSRVGVAQSLVFFVVFCRSLFVFSGVPVAPSLVFFVVFCRSLFVLLSFVFCLFGHCIVRPLIYGFYLPICYLQTFHIGYLNSLHACILHVHSKWTKCVPYNGSRFIIVWETRFIHWHLKMRRRRNDNFTLLYK